MKIGVIVGSLLVLAANADVVSFKDAAKIKSWDAWDDHKKQAAPNTVLEKEKRCVTMERLYTLQPGAGREIGRIKTRTASEVKSSKWSVGCECLAASSTIRTPQTLTPRTSCTTETSGIGP